MHKLLSRKFIIAVWLLFAAFFLFETGKLNADQYIMLSGSIAAVYGLANVTQKQ